MLSFTHIERLKSKWFSEEYFIEVLHLRHAYGNYELVIISQTNHTST